MEATYGLAEEQIGGEDGRTVSVHSSFKRLDFTGNMDGPLLTECASVFCIDS